MNWVNKQRLPAIKIIKYNSLPCLEINNLWQALHSSFNTAQSHIIDESVFPEIGHFLSSPWIYFLKEEFTSVITKCSNKLAPSPDKLTWRHIKLIVKDKIYLKNIIDITNIYFEVMHWPSHFKSLTTIIIPKPNKPSYNSSKLFRPIILLNSSRKLIKKVIGNRLQFHVLSNSFIYQSQLEGLKSKSTPDAGLVLTHFIHMEWVKNLTTSTLVFDIA